MQEYQQALEVYKAKDMRMRGCKNTNKHSEYMNLWIWGCEDTNMHP